MPTLNGGPIFGGERVPTAAGELQKDEEFQIDVESGAFLISKPVKRLVLAVKIDSSFRRRVVIGQ
jgi:hypothetical protein